MTGPIPMVVGETGVWYFWKGEWWKEAPPTGDAINLSGGGIIPSVVVSVFGLKSLYLKGAKK